MKFAEKIGIHGFGAKPTFTNTKAPKKDVAEPENAKEEHRKVIDTSKTESYKATKSPETEPQPIRTVTQQPKPETKYDSNSQYYNKGHNRQENVGRKGSH